MFSPPRIPRLDAFVDLIEMSEIGHIHPPSSLSGSSSECHFANYLGSWPLLVARSGHEGEIRSIFRKWLRRIAVSPKVAKNPI
jgi:hypothetical protein